MSERPDDSGLYDDETLLQIIAERFSRHPDPVTSRDGSWLIATIARLTRQLEEAREALLRIADGSCSQHWLPDTPCCDSSICQTARDALARLSEGK
jgi:hypothetical protein